MFYRRQFDTTSALSTRTTIVLALIGVTLTIFGVWLNRNRMANKLMIEGLLHQDPAAIEAGLQRGAEPQLRLEDGVSPLHLALQPKSANLLLQAGADPNHADDRGNRPLHMVRHPEVAELLIKAGARVNQPNEWRQYPLHFSVVRQETAVAEVLLKAGANPNKRDGRGQTPLWLAVESGDKETAALLLKYGAKNLKGKGGLRPSDLAKRQGWRLLP